jgi:hypothetical protein
MSIITNISNSAEFFKCLHNNPGRIIIKFTAEWCGPCNKIKKMVDEHIHRNINNPKIQFYILDIDTNFELYAFLKKKKMISGIPAILCWNKSNIYYIPDDFISGTDKEQISLFFERCTESL